MSDSNLVSTTDDAANDLMTTFDKILGAFLFLIALPAAIQANVHWFAIALLIAACLVFVGFIVEAKKNRCSRCGHYYPLNAYEAYLEKTKTKRCGDCTLVTEPGTQDTSAI